MIREGFFPTLIYAEDFKLNTEDLAQNIINWSNQDKGIKKQMLMVGIVKLICMKNPNINF